MNRERLARSKGQAAPTGDRRDRPTEGDPDALRVDGHGDEAFVNLAPQHVAMLRASGITAALAKARGYRSVERVSQIAGRNLSREGRTAPGMLIPMLRADGSEWGIQYRPDSPRERDGKPVKYETPVGQRAGLDVPPSVGPKLADPRIPLWIAEGSRKADAAACAGLAAVSISGVWSWRGGNDRGGKVALAEWHDVALNDRRVILAFDSDVICKPSVRQALDELAGYLASKGARVEYAHLPDADGKCGLDDFLAEHDVAELWSLVHPQPPGQTEADDEADQAARFAGYGRTGPWLVSLAPLRFAVPGIVPEGYGLVTGSPKVGKSWLTLDWGQAVAHGSVTLGGIPVGPPRPVLLLALEDGERRLRARCAVLTGSDEPPALLTRATSIPREDVLAYLTWWLDGHGEDGALVLLDTLARVMPRALVGESPYERDYRIGVALKSIADAHAGSSLAVVHHVRKMDDGDWLNSTSGTNGLAGSADFIVNLSRGRGENSGLLRVTGRDIDDGAYAMTFDGGRWRLDGDSLAEADAAAKRAQDVYGLADRSASIVRLVAQHPLGIGPTAVAEALGLEPNAAGEYLGRLVSAGRIRRTGRGKYLPREPVETVESVETPGQDDLGVSTLPGECGNGPGLRPANSTLSTLSTAGVEGDGEVAS